jgi:hypothetical protein
MMIEKKAKDAVKGNMQRQAIAKLKQKEAPLAKYYKDQVHKNAMEINATGLNLALGVTQTQLATGQTPRNVL